VLIGHEQGVGGRDPTELGVLDDGGIVEGNTRLGPWRPSWMLSQRILGPVLPARPGRSFPLPTCSPRE